MSNQSPAAAPALPEPLNLRRLKEQANDLLRAGQARSIADGQFQIARMHGFANWPKLKAHIDLLSEAGKLTDAINQNDVSRVQTLMMKCRELHGAPIGYAKDGPLTWVAECRVPRSAPSDDRLEMAKWMLENGSDVHQGGDSPLMRSALDGERIPMMEMLVSHGADVNAAWHGVYPIIFAACEALDPVSLRWLLDHGADPNCGTAAQWNARGVTHPGTALDYLLGAYVRDPEVLEVCIELLLTAGGKTKYDVPAVLAILRRRLDQLTELLNANPSLVHQRFPELDFGTTAGRMLTLRGATLLHVAAEYLNLPAIKLLLNLGADVNAAATVDEAGIGGQTAVFHAATQSGDHGLDFVKYLVDHGASLSTRVKILGRYDAPGEVVEATPLSYALLFPGTPGLTVEFLRQQGAPE